MEHEFDKEAFSKRLKEIRKSKNLTQDEICDKSDLDVSNYSKMETGKVLPSVKSLYKITKGLDMEPNDFFEFDHFVNEDTLDKKIQKIYKNLSVKEKQFLYKFLKSLKDYGK